MFKNIFDLLIRLILQPAKAWDTLSDKQETNNDLFFKSYLYPLFGLVALLSFVGVFFSSKSFDIQLALKNSIRLIIAVFIGFYLASFLLSEVMKRIFDHSGEIKLCQRFVGYSSSLIYVLSMILSLFPEEFFFLYIFLFYTIYIIWEGSVRYMYIKEKEQVKFSAFASMIILVCPYLINTIMYMLMPGLRV